LPARFALVGGKPRLGVPFADAGQVRVGLAVLQRLSRLHSVGGVVAVRLLGPKAHVGTQPGDGLFAQAGAFPVVVFAGSLLE
jgi:hypothetical protein